MIVSPDTPPAQAGTWYRRPWVALAAVLFGLFMILLDSTIVAVANPAIKAAFDVDYPAAVWVTSAYLLGYAVPLLITGRLGDQFGPRTMYLTGLAVFTVASLWCGLSDSIGMLSAARVVQGLGAAMLTPQTLAVIQRVFPPERRGMAMGVWGAVGGVATLVGPLAGGVLIDGWGWQWIFYVNIPVGVVGMILGAVYIPRLSTQSHRLDLIGMALSAGGLLAFVFALQEGEHFHWTGWVWALMALGAALLAAFVWWQAVNPGEPLITLGLFTHRNFSLSGLGMAAMGFTTVGMALPMMFYTQVALGLSPTSASLTQAPTAVVNGLLAPVAGWLVNRIHPARLIGGGMALMIVALLWWAALMRPDTLLWQLMIPAGLIGAAMACIWGPMATAATCDLPLSVAGAASGVYSTLRQVGGVVGGAAMGGLMTARLAAEMPADAAREAVSRSAILPDELREPFSSAMAQSLLFAAAALLVGLVAALFLRPVSALPQVLSRADAKLPQNLTN